jgi:hypothetical protein
MRRQDYIALFKQFGFVRSITPLAPDRQLITFEHASSAAYAVVTKKVAHRGGGRHLLLSFSEKREPQAEKLQVFFWV